MGSFDLPNKGLAIDELVFRSELVIVRVKLGSIETLTSAMEEE